MDTQQNQEGDTQIKSTEEDTQDSTNNTEGTSAENTSTTDQQDSEAQDSQTSVTPQEAGHDNPTASFNETHVAGENTDQNHENTLPQPVVTQSKPKHKYNLNIIIAVIITLMIALALIGLVYAAYVASNQTAEQAPVATQSNEQTTSDSQAATSDDVDQGIKDVDGMVSELDQQESLEIDISDSALGIQ